MMKSYAPKTMAELPASLAALTPESKIVGGGTDFVIRLHSGAVQPDALCYLGHIPELKKIEKQGDTISVGAYCTMTQMEHDPIVREYLPALMDAAADVGSLQIRNNGTIGIGQFVMAAFSGSATRLSGLMGNPNAMGAMLALGWFALQSCLREENGPALERFLRGLEFITLTALALTLSLGAFGALGIGVLVMHFYGKECFSSLLCRLAEMIFAGGCGILLYIAGNATNWPWLCLILCGYILIGAWYRGQFERELSDGKWAKLLICLTGALGVGVVAFLRPNAAATFAERLAMIRNGLGYLGVDPLLGVGPYQWRRLNLQDADTYFNTWHIHNVFVHVGVELGLIAMAMLAIAVVRHFRKREDPAQRGAFSAALVHNLMDTSFFYMATVPFLIMTAGDDEGKKRRLSGTTVKCMFSVFAVLFAWNMVQIFW